MNVDSAETDKENYDMHKNFETELTFCDYRYATRLPFKLYDEVIPDNFSNAKRRLNSLQRKLDKHPSLSENYSSIIEGYKSQGILEEVTESGKLENVHYFPHQLVARTEKDTTKLRIVFDESFFESFYRKVTRRLTCQ